MSPHLRHLLGLATIAVVLVACGGKIDSNGDGGNDGTPDGAADDAGWTACSSPSGYQLCGGPADCTNPGCAFCFREPGEPAGICGEVDSNGNPLEPDPLAPYSGCTCKDGAVCLIGEPGDAGPEQGMFALDQCVPWEAGELAFRAGAKLIYADTSTFDGTPLPAPGDCPTIPGLTLCGGACGDTCPPDATSHVCIGRSPKHPYSLCAAVPKLATSFDCSRSNPPSDGKHGCLIFHDAPADQPFADVNGVFIDLPTCQAAAAGYPGGADCVTK